MSISILNSKQNPTSDLKSRCYTCLSLGRNLKPMKTEDKFFLGMLCPEMFFHNKCNIQYLYLMCWECQYIIVKIKRFQARVSKAQAQIKLTLQGVKSIINSISNLKFTEIETIDILAPALQTIPINQNQPTLKEIPHPFPPTLTSLNVDPEIIKIETEEEEKCLDNDYDELIPPIKITQPSSGESTATASESELYDDPLRTPKEKTTKIKPGTAEVFAQKANEHAIISSTVKPTLRKVIIKIPKENLALTEYRQAVKVTSLVTSKTVPNLVKKKESVPTLLKTKDGYTIIVSDKGGASIVANHTGSVPNLIKGKVVPITSKLKEPILKRLIILPTSPSSPKVTPSRESEREPRMGINGYKEDEVKCTILNETELKTYRDKKRSTRRYKGHPYKCERCIQAFWNQKHLDQHNMKHDKSRGSSMCEVCEQIFSSKSVRNEHYKNHFIVYECLKCQYRDNDRIKTSEHIRRVHDVSVFECNKCDAIFKTFREKRRHGLTAHSTRKRSTCEECGKTFQCLTRLKVHLATHQRETKACPVCKKKIRKNYLEKHMKTHEDTRMDSAYCVDCEKMFKSEKSYALHLKTSLKHNTVEKIGIKCDHCNQYFHKKSALKDHLEEVNGIKYTCDICKKNIKNKTSLYWHIRKRHEGKKYQMKPRICEYCGKSFNSKQGLTQHINSHLGLEPYACTDCGASFSHSGSLFTHRKLVHKVKRRYEVPT